MIRQRRECPRGRERFLSIKKKDTDTDFRGIRKGVEKADNTHNKS